jgi:thymidylate kinase
VSYLFAYFSPSRIRRTQILEDLNRGRTVVCDRYAFSGIAFSVIKVRNSLAASLPRAKHRSANRRLTGKLTCY